MNRKKIAEALRQLADALVDDSLEITDGIEFFKDSVFDRCAGADNRGLQCMRRKHADDVHAINENGAWRQIIGARMPEYRKGLCKHCNVPAQMRDGTAWKHDTPQCADFFEHPGLT